MATPLDPMRGLLGSQSIQPQTPQRARKTQEGVDKNFQTVLNEFVEQADQAQHQFDDAIAAVERGETDNLHQVMLAQNQAQLSLKLAAEVRNKLVEAYKEVMRTQF